jgi:hypothetical protein
VGAEDQGVVTISLGEQPDDPPTMLYRNLMTMDTEEMAGPIP